ncbi:beta strand repeat-containing protein [Zavarzinella formosa]|uniref:beta strand repeat-containing protein n=1 Tax=Zavarzinella formosa TaxID=360055 RepID=UPI0002EADA9A|nr:hypothetical protein [Zavarzinella formosa]
MLFFPRTRSQASRNRKTTLGVEQFGERIVPAGLVDVTFMNGTLKIMGDAADNTLTVTQTADNRLTLTTDIGTGLRVNGTNVSGFMGHTLTTPVTGGVTVNMGAGIDSLTFNGATEDIDLPSFLNINGGDGNNLLTFQQGVTVGGDVTITNGLGLDTIHLNDELNFLGKTTINNGKGGSLIDSNATTDLRVGGVFSVTNGAGFDKLDWKTAQNVKLGGYVQSTGADTDGSEFDLSPVKSLTINGAVKVTNGAGSDLLDLGDPTLVTKITGALTVANGAGFNHTDVIGADSLFVGGPINFTGGANDDLVHLGLNSNLVSFGAITITGGAGSNSSIVAGTELNVVGNVSVIGGAGSDSLQFVTTNDSLITGAVSLTLGAGANSLTADSGNGTALSIGKTLNFLSTSAAPNSNTVELRAVRIQGAATITTGGGNDLILIDDVTFAGKFTLNTSGGTDTVNIEQLAGWTGHTNFLGAVVIQTGVGDDTVKVSDVLAKPEQKAIFASSVKFDGGLGTDTLQLSDFGANLFYGSPAVKISF